MLSPEELHEHFKFKKFPKGLVQVGATVVEKLAKNNVGKDFGKVVNPYGDDWEVAWADGSVEMIKNPLKNLALSLQVDQQIMVNGKLHACSKYDKGCWLQPCESSPDVKRKRSKKESNAAPQSPKRPKNKKTKAKAQSPSWKRRAWKRCRAKKLTNGQRSILTDLYKGGKHSEVSIMFAERSLQEYMVLQKTPLHLNCKNILTAAIGQVMCQVVPDTDKPLGGDVDKVCEVLFTICQKVRVLAMILLPLIATISESLLTTITSLLAVIFLSLLTTMCT